MGDDNIDQGLSAGLVPFKMKMTAEPFKCAVNPWLE
jgi:hypothetical protein